VVVLVLAMSGFGCKSDDEPEASAHDADAGSDAGAPLPARIYVTVARDNEIAVLDYDTHEVVDHIEVGRGPAILLATPDKKKLYSANWSNFTVSAVTLANKKVKSLQMKGRPYVIAMSPDGKHVYAGLQTNEIVTISTKTDTVENTFATDVLPASIIVSPDGETLYVATLNSNIRAISASTGETLHAQIRTGASPAWITIGKDGSRVYTLNFLSDDVSVVDTEKFEVVDTVSTGAGSSGIIGNVTPDGSRLYITNHGTGELIAIDTATHELVQTIKLDGRPVGVNFNADGSRVYTTDFGPKSLDAPVDSKYLLTGSFSTTDPGQVRAFDTQTGEEIGEPVVLGPGPTSVVVIE
jgi:YVTN family beta-propeller protein